MRVHQLMPVARPGDATSNQALEIDSRLRTWGYDSRVYAQVIDDSLVARVRPDTALLEELQQADDLFIYHFSLFHPNMLLLRVAQGHRILIYHNITPAQFYAGWDSGLQHLCQVSRSTLRLFTSCDLGVGDSNFNRQELVTAGFEEKRTAVLPIFLSLHEFNAVPVSETLQRRLRDSGDVNWLTVGRVVPNKSLQDAMRIFAVYHHVINPRSRLYIVGSTSLRRYSDALRELAVALDLKDQVIFTGQVSNTELKTYYQCADLYLTTSHHEGFCVPLIESMHFGVPILAHKSSAIPETLGGAGVLYGRLGFEEIAEMAHLMIGDSMLRQQIIKGQTERLTQIGPEQAESSLRDIITRFG